MHSHLLFYASNLQVNTDRPSSFAVLMMSLIVVHDVQLSNTVGVRGGGVRAVEVQGGLDFRTWVFAQFCL